MSGGDDFPRGVRGLDLEDEDRERKVNEMVEFLAKIENVNPRDERLMGLVKTWETKVFSKARTVGDYYLTLNKLMKIRKDTSTIRAEVIDHSQAAGFRDLSGTTPATRVPQFSTIVPSSEEVVQPTQAQVQAQVQVQVQAQAQAQAQVQVQVQLAAGAPAVAVSDEMEQAIYPRDESDGDGYPPRLARARVSVGSERMGSNFGELFIDMETRTRKIQTTTAFLAHIEGKDPQDRTLYALAAKFESKIFVAAMNVEDYNHRISKKLNEVQKLHLQLMLDKHQQQEAQQQDQACQCHPGDENQMFEPDQHEQTR